MQLASQLRARRTGADNRHVQLAGTYWRLLCLCADAGIHQEAIKALGVGRSFQLHCMFGNARRSEVVGDAADRYHQCVVADGPRWGDLTPFVVEHGGEANLLCGTVKPGQFAVSVTESVPMCLSEVVYLVLTGIEATRRDGVQHRLPQMRSCTIDQREARQPAPAKAGSEPGSKFEPRRAAAHGDDLVQRFVGWGRVDVHRRPLRQAGRELIASAFRYLLHDE